jgi:diguanylate cyclase (GGDEF)-like protein
VDADRDPGYLRFRRDSVKLASASAIVAIAMLAAYLAATWDRPHRAALTVVCSAALGMVVLILGLRADRLVETRWCELFFGTGSTLYVFTIAGLTLLDGGNTSPLAVIYFPVVVFAGLCYPRGLAIFVGVACVTSDLVVGAAAGGGSADHVLFVAGALALTAVMCAWQAHTLDGQRRELARASRTDHLTGSLNRRGFYARAEEELARAERGGSPLAFVLVDLDDFKRVNDAHGHAAGDELLRWVVQALQADLRPSDAVARLGGDEFAALLPGLDAAGAAEVADRMRADLRERTSASFGVAAYPEMGDVEELLARADAQLYADKARRDPSAGPGVVVPQSFYA